MVSNRYWWLVVGAMMSSGCAGTLGMKSLPAIEGVVRAADGDPVEGVRITVVLDKDADDPYSASCSELTNLKGAFWCESLRTLDKKTIPLKSRHVYRLTFKQPGYESVQYRFRYQSDLEPFEIEVKDGIRMDRVTIKGVEVQPIGTDGVIPPR